MKTLAEDKPAAPAKRVRRQNVFDRTVHNLVLAWRDLAGRVGNLTPFESGKQEGLEAFSEEDMRARLQACLKPRGGEVSARTRTAELGRCYLRFSRRERAAFLGLLTREFGVDMEAVGQAMDETHASSGSGPALRKLREALTPPRVLLLRQFNALHSGVKFLVDLRADLLDFRKADPDLTELEQDLRALLTSWFDIGFLELRSINWDSPASLLEKLGHYEAVHKVRGWRDLKNRLDSDRRCFAYFHPSMPEEPLIFVEVALVSGLAGSIQDLLDEQAPLESETQADTAIFFSISKTQKGLTRINLGNFLIKRVVDQLQRELKNIKTFATLSPIPGFMSWLAAWPDAIEAGLLDSRERDALSGLFSDGQGPAALPEFLKNPQWIEQARSVTVLEPILLKLCAHYLLEAKSERHPSATRDPVAHFHLSNGARIERINWLADTSRKGLAESAGMMVNYRYRGDRIEAYHEAYAETGKIAIARAVKSLV